MSNEDILKENNGKKIDIILMNPPYSQKLTGDGLYVKFINKCIHITDKLISINPAGAVLEHSSGSLARTAFKEFRGYMDEKYIDIEEISPKLFNNAAIKSGIVIIYIDNKKEHNIIYKNINNNTTSFNKQVDINKYFDNKFLVTFDKQIRKFLSKNECFEQHIKLTKGYSDFAKAKLKEKNPDENLLYVYFLKPNTSFKYMAYSQKNKNEFYRVKEYNEEDQKVSCAYVTFKKSEFNKAKNCMSYINTDFVRLCIIFATLSTFTSINRYQVIPWLDFSKEWTDEELFKMIGMDYDKEEIHKIFNEQ